MCELNQKERKRQREGGGVVGIVTFIHVGFTDFTYIVESQMLCVLSRNKLILDEKYKIHCTYFNRIEIYILYRWIFSFVIIDQLSGVPLKKSNKFNKFKI